MTWSRRIPKHYPHEFLRGVRQDTFSNNSGVQSITLTHIDSGIVLPVKAPFRFREIDEARQKLWELSIEK